MARIFFVKDGTSSDYRTDEGRVVPNAIAGERLARFPKKHFVRPPNINPKRGPSVWTDQYGHVVVKIDQDEVDSHFPKAGYYYVLMLSPHECERIFKWAKDS